MCKAKLSNSRTFTKKSIKTFLKPLKFRSLRIPRNIRMVAYVGFKTEKEMRQALLKDKSFLGESATARYHQQSIFTDLMLALLLIHWIAYNMVALLFSLLFFYLLYLFINLFIIIFFNNKRDSSRALKISPLSAASHK